MELSRNEIINIVNIWHECLRKSKNRRMSYKYLPLLPCVAKGYHKDDTIEAARELNDDFYGITALNRCIRLSETDTDKSSAIKKYKFPIICKDLRTKERIKVYSEKELINFVKPKVHPKITETEILKGARKVIDDHSVDGVKSWAGIMFIQEGEIPVIDYLAEVNKLYDRYYRINKKYFNEA